MLDRIDQMSKAIKARKTRSQSNNGDIDLTECLDCLCYEFSKTARLVNSYYDAGLQAVDLKSNQFIILAAVGYMKETNFKNLAEFIGIDQSTLVRNIVTGERQSFVKIRPGKNKREKLISLRRKGKNKLHKAFPRWKKAQTDILDVLGRERWKNIRDELSDVVSATRELS